MVFRSSDSYVCLEHNYKEYDLMISDGTESNKSKSEILIKFSIHPNSEHKKGWIISSLDDPEKEYEVLHEIYEPITGNSFEIEMNKFMFLSSTSTSSSGIITKRISDALLSRAPFKSNQKRYSYANKIVSYARKVIAEKAKTIGTSTSSSNILPNIQIEILVDIFTLTSIFIDNEEAAEMAEYKRSHPDIIPASLSAVAALERRRFGDGNNDHANPNPTCPICLEEYLHDEAEEEGESLLTIIRMPCCHEFHANCITKWLQKSHDCPMCRFELPISLYEDCYNPRK